MATLQNPTITPHLWFQEKGKEAIDFYCSLFPDSKITRQNQMKGTPSGDIDVFSFQLWGVPFGAMNCPGPFTFNQGVSFFVYCGSEQRIDELFAKLSEGGKVMMALDKYPWTSKYAWVQDRFGISWQLDIDDIKSDQKIAPALLFVNENKNRIREAIDLYTSVFPDSKILVESPFPPEHNMPEGSILFAQTKLNGYILNCMSGGNHAHDIKINEAISLMVHCKDQAEIDHYWNSLTANGGEESMCGWLKDPFGVSWQIDPVGMEDLMNGPGKEGAFKAMMGMKKLDVAKLKAAAGAM
jgi:predicted 3-demethylubiquinone-9 3-methyltransferase (glyoxalase superfamily)